MHASTAFPTRIAIAFLLACIAPAAFAATLTITGRVLPGTCTLADAQISLDPVKANEMTVGANALKAGALNFTGCIGVTKATLTFDGTAADGDAERWKNTASTGPADGVSVALLAGATGTTYLKRGDSGIVVPVTGATTRYALRAGYYLPVLGGLTAGAVQTEITVTAAYD